MPQSSEMSEASKSENAVRITARLYEFRDYVRRMTTPDEYKKHMTEYQSHIRTAMEKWNLDSLPATMRLVERLQQQSIPEWKINIITSGLFAAYVEMIEQA